MGLSAATPNATAWVDRILTKHWDRLERYAGAARMPEIHRRTKTRRIVQEHGCGHYGCVMPTGTPGLVIKLSTDPSEASFVGQYLSFDKDEIPQGMVRYEDLVVLPDESHRKRPVFVLWREEAFKVGELVYQQGASEKRALRRLGQFKRWAADARDRMKRIGLGAKLFEDIRRRKEWAEEVVDWDTVSRADQYAYEVRPRHLKGVDAIAWDLRAAHITAEEMVGEGVGYAIGEMLVWCLDEGMLLADVHGQNVGKAMREGYRQGLWVITDPGHMVPLEVRRMDFRVKEL